MDPKITDMHAIGSTPVSLSVHMQMDIPESIRGSEFLTGNASEADFFVVDAWLYAARMNIAPKGKQPCVPTA